MTEYQSSMQDFERRFEEIYLSYRQGMVRFAGEYVPCRQDCENIVQDAFAEIWEARGKYLNRDDNLLALTFKTIKNRCIDFLRHREVVHEAENLIQEELALERKLNLFSLESFDDELFSSGCDIDKLITDAINALPEKCRQIFTMSKIEGKRQKDIARELNITINTVETQMAVAYKKLREELKPFLPLLLFLLNLL
ncbi:MAG: RNA polymerase sigma-70 factor [Tannerella sp.]|jgi:RNA polymerase sigma-70 factor (ECF subfamily)|nr:RNA polymerase sigma-70 factor [Tannerella sp.]